MGPLDQETGLLTHVLGMTHHLGLQATVLACVLEHETASLCLSPCFSPGHHHEEATQTPFFPDGLRCPANVSPPDNRCAGRQARLDPAALPRRAAPPRQLGYR